MLMITILNAVLKFPHSMLIKNLILIPANIHTKRWHSTIRVNLTLKWSETLSRQFIVNSHGGIKAAAFLTEMIRRMVFLTTFLYSMMAYKIPRTLPVSPAPAQAVFIKCHDWSDCYWSLCPHSWLVEAGTSSSQIATEHCVTGHSGLSSLRAAIG